MSKSISSGMLAHIAGPLTTLAFCWQITRRDAQIFRFTTFDTDIEYPSGSGNIYSSEQGGAQSAIQTNTDYSVGNLNFNGFLSPDSITDQDLAAGKFNGSEIKIFLVNWADTSATMGDIKLMRGWFGQATVTKQGMIQIELRSITQKLQQLLGSQYSQVCQHTLGDSGCKVPIKPAEVQRSTTYAVGDIVRVPDTVPAPDSSSYHDRLFTCTQAGATASSAPVYDYTVGNSTTDGTAIFKASEAWTRAGVIASGTQTTAGNRKSFNVTLTEARAVDDWFAAGVLTWETGNNAGISTEVKHWTQTGSIMQLRFATPYVPQAGDKFRVYAGCNLFLSGCKKFSNVINRLGFDNIPGEIVIIGYGIGDGNVSVASS